MSDTSAQKSNARGFGTILDYGYEIPLQIQTDIPETNSNGDPNRLYFRCSGFSGTLTVAEAKRGDQFVLGPGNGARTCQLGWTFGDKSGTGPEVLLWYDRSIPEPLRSQWNGATEYPDGFLASYNVNGTQCAWPWEKTEGSGKKPAVKIDNTPAGSKSGAVRVGAGLLAVVATVVGLVGF